MAKGIFITFEGGEGAGKTTQSYLLKNYFDSLNQPCMLTREPGGSMGAEAIRSLVLEDNFQWSYKTQLLLFLAARQDHLEKTILPALNSGIHVICDRFFHSTLAYQGYAYNQDIQTITQMCQFVHQDTIPDRTYVLQIPPKEGLKRVNERHQKLDSFEIKPLEFHEKLYRGFEALAQNDHFMRLLNGMDDIHHIAYLIQKDISCLIPKTSSSTVQPA